ncbi:hypothetical protein JTB14_030814 [Gonioctena quinquepunctata]|nr:hypothetical protein JTB14_030814 [Gonioctena quinquepunctata]
MHFLIFQKPPSPSTATSSASAAIPEVTLPKVSSPKPTKISTVPTTPITHTNTTITASSKSETKVSSNTSSLKSSSHSPRSPTKPTSDHSPKSKTANPTEYSSSSSSSSSSSRHKKSRKSNSNTKITKEFDPDVHCGVVEGNRGPCTRSITCSSHRIQLRKLVPGRSKDIHQLIAERKTVKEKESKHGSNCSYTSPNGQTEEKESFSQNTTYVPFVAAVVSTTESSDKAPYVPIMPKSSDSSTHSRKTTTSVLTAKQPTLTDSENAPSKTKDNNYIMNIHSQESAIGTVPVVYMPMSPISVVSPVQFVQIGKNVICLESPQSAMSPPLTTNRSVYLSIPNHNSNVEMYKSHPKPVAVPNYGTKKVGGAILLSNQHAECQRNDILMAMNSRRKIINNTHGYRAISLLNHTNNIQHRPNILKVKSINKVNCKRSAVEKLNTSDTKQIRLTASVNGLNSDISESAEAPQSNCIQEKIALLNMK